MVDVRHTVVELSQFSTVPAIRGSHKIPRDALQLVNVGRTALRTLLQMIVGILVAAVHTAVTVMIHRAIAHVELIHHIHHTHDHLWVMGGITIDLHVEDMTTTRHLMIRGLHLSLMTGRALEIDRHMVGVGIVVAIRHARNHTKLLTVFLRELTRKSLCWCRQYGVVMMIQLTEVVDALTHITDNLQTKCLTLLTLTMVLTSQSHQTLSQSDEAYTERTLIDHTLNRIVGSQFIGTDPETLHQQGELLGKGRLLELETVVELLGSHFKHVIELGKEHIDSLLLILFLTALEGQFHDINRRERQVSTSDTGLRSETVLKHTGTTTHRSHLMHIPLRIVGTPLTVLVVGGL